MNLKILITGAAVVCAGAVTAAGFYIGGADEDVALPNGEHVLTFRTNGAIRVCGNGSVRLLVVGGGGGGGVAFGGGGGGGEVVEMTDFAVTNGLYPVSVGAGGAGANLIASYSEPDANGVVTTNWPAAQAGGESSAFGVVALGGAGGGGQATELKLNNGNWKYTFSNNGQDGFSGGGGASCGAAGAAGKGTVVLPDGRTNDGGAGYRKTSAPACYAGGGGGGAAGAGLKYVAPADEVTTICWPTGGVGVVSSVTGVAVEYGHGGMGGTNGTANAKAGSGCTGTGEGGAGARAATSNSNWRNNLGDKHAGGDGGSGIVIIRYTPDMSGIGFDRQSGGTVVKKDGSYIHSFSESGKFVVTGDLPIIVEALVVAGGGGGGVAFGGGGGGGQVVRRSSLLVYPGEHEICVGVGGAGANLNEFTVTNADMTVVTNCPPAQNGGDSTAFGIAAVGGGAGGGAVVGVYQLSPLKYTFSYVGGDGGSGGGGASCTIWGAGGKGLVEIGAGTTNDGADAYRVSGVDYAGGGGGGAAGAGVRYVPASADVEEVPPFGGEGIVSSISGEPVEYGRGGSGGRVVGGSNNHGADGVAGTGAGGGGASAKKDNTTWRSALGALHSGGNGASGIVIVRYPAKTAGLMLLLR